MGGRSRTDAADSPAAAPTASGVAPAGIAAAAVPDDRGIGRREDERAGHQVGVGPDDVAGLELPTDEGTGERVLDQALDRPLERPRPECRVRALANDECLRGLGELEMEVLAGQAAGQVGHEQFDDGPEVVVRQGVEDDDLVDPVEELRSELDAQGVHDLAPHRVVRGVPDLGIRGGDGRRSDVAGHDHHGVLEVHGPALRVGQATVVEDLEQDVEDIRVGLLDLVEQDDLVWPTADGLGQLAALLVADIAGRRPDQPRDGELLHVLAHVDADHRLLVVEQEAGEGAGELGLADAGRAEEQERADRTARVLEPGTCPADGVGHGLDGLVLADDALVEALLHADELGLLAFHQAADRDAGPGARRCRRCRPRRPLP